MLKLLRRNEDGLQTIGVSWREESWNRGGVELWLETPGKQDYHKPARFVIKLVYGPGAGYIGGMTAFFGFRCKDRTRGGNIYLRKLFQMGITRNANIVPYPY